VESLLSGAVASHHPHGLAQTSVCPPGGARSSGLAICFGVEGLDPLWAEPEKGESTPVRGSSPVAVVPMILLRVLVKEFLCQGLMGREPTLECFSVSARGCLWLRLGVFIAGLGKLV
jgi:hypothetical protein